MAAVGRIQLTRVPAREPRNDATPKRLRDDAVEREFGDDLDDETTRKSQKPAQVPTPEQLALAGMIAPQQVATHESALPTFDAHIADVTATVAQKRALVSITDDMPGDISHDRSACGESDERPTTPLEQAVIDMLEKHEAMPELAIAKSEVRDTPSPRIAQAAPVVAPRELPTHAAPTSHINLVMDDGDRRVVVTVAVRGNDVNVHMRGGDDVTAGLARNAGSLDEAMRARGLSLAAFTAHPEPDQHDPRERQPYERRESVKEVFALEETP